MLKPVSSALVAIFALSIAVDSPKLGHFGVDTVSAATAASPTTPAPAKPATPATPAKTITTSTTYSTLTGITRLLKLNSAGNDVKLLQSSLNNKGYKLTVDGVFGKLTLVAVKDYQEKNGLKVDGIVGPMVIKKLSGVVATSTTLEAAKVDYSGTYIGYAWADEVKGTTLGDTTKKIQTILELDKGGMITDASVLSFKKVDGYWVLRQSGNATVSVDFSMEPTKAVPGEKYVAGNSMFKVKTGADDLMSFYSTAVDKDGTIAVLMACPVTRYLFEMKFKPDYNYSSKVGSVTIDSGLLVPTVLTESGGIKITDWSQLSGKSIFNFSPFSHVLGSRGVLTGINDTSTIQEFMEKMGVVFKDSKPVPMSAKYGYTGNGGWSGNYAKISEFLKGKNALEMTSLVDWSIERYSKGINAKNFFGVDIVSGATKTVQNSYDAIAGATVRMSRESNSYQRALVKAKIIKEKDVIKGRY